MGLEGIRSEIQTALTRWGPTQVGLILATSTAGIDASEEAMATYCADGYIPQDYDFEYRHAFHAPLEALAIESGLVDGPRFVVSTACSSSCKALGTAQRLIANNVVDAVVIAAADSLCKLTLRGFASLQILATEHCRPFNTNRGGLNLGEGAAFLICEKETQQANLFLLGVGECSDAHHMTAPNPEGIGPMTSIQQALDISGLNANNINYVNAHGTGTTINDLVEGIATQKALGQHVPVSSSKPQMGHLLGAAGLSEAIICLEAIKRNQIPPSLGCNPIDERLSINVRSSLEDSPIDYALSNNLGFGGSNATAIVGRSPQKTDADFRLSPVYILDIAFWSEGCTNITNWQEHKEDPSISKPEASILSRRSRGRASSLTRMFAEIYGKLSTSLTDIYGEETKVPCVYASAFGEIETTQTLLKMLHVDDGMPSPLKFQASVHNTAAGAMSIATGNTCFSTSLAAGYNTAAAAMLEAISYISIHRGPIMVLLADERPHPPLFRTTFPALAYGLLLTTEPTSDRILGKLSNLSLKDVPPQDFGQLSANPSSGGLELMLHVSSKTRCIDKWISLTPPSTKPMPTWGICYNG